jgi:hypothetical protein
VSSPPQLAADPFTAELKNLAITHVVFPIEIRLDNSLPHLRAAARLDQGFRLSTEVAIKAGILPATA